MYFQTKLNVDTHDIDYNGEVRASAYMRYMQIAADAQLTDNGLSFEELRRLNRAFILSRMTIEINKPLKEHEPIIAESFATDSHGFGFLRCYRIMRGESEIARAIAQWALIDTETRALVRVSDFKLGLPILKQLDLTIGRFGMPHTIVEVGSYTVGYGDTDRNGHMNNTRYPDVYATFLPIVGKRITRISINFIKEAPYGTTIKVQMAKAEGDKYYIRTVLPDGTTNTEAEIYMMDI